MTFYFYQKCSEQDLKYAIFGNLNNLQKQAYCNVYQ